MGAEKGGRNIGRRGGVLLSDSSTPGAGDVERRQERRDTMTYQDPFNPLPRDWDRNDRPQDTAYRSGRSYSGAAVLAVIVGVLVIIALI